MKQSFKCFSYFVVSSLLKPVLFLPALCHLGNQSFLCSYLRYFVAEGHKAFYLLKNFWRNAVYAVFWGFISCSSDITYDTVTFSNVKLLKLTLGFILRMLGHILYFVTDFWTGSPKWSELHIRYVLLEMSKGFIDYIHWFSLWRGMITYTFNLI